MSIRIMQEVWEHSPVSGGTLLVLLALADSADDKLRSCFPGIESLAHKARLSDRQVKRAISELADRGIIKVERNASPYKTNLYTLKHVSEWPREDNMSPPAVAADGPSATAGGDMDVPSDGTPVSPKPSVTSEQPSDLFGSYEPQRCVSAKKDPEEAFHRFWAAYPVKKGKGDAERAFQSAVKKGADPEQIIAAAKVYAETEQGRGQYAKYPQGWLNGKRYEDEDIQPRIDDAERRRRRLMGPQFGEIVR